MDPPFNWENTAEAGAYPLESRVLLRGLSNADFNGKIGIIRGQVKDGRQPVFLPDLNKTVSIKMENIKPKPSKRESSKKKSMGVKATSFSAEELPRAEKSTSKKPMRRSKTDPTIPDTTTTTNTTTPLPTSGSSNNLSKQQRRRQSTNETSQPLAVESPPASPIKGGSSHKRSSMGHGPGRFVQSAGNIVKSGVGLVRNTAKGGANLAKKTSRRMTLAKSPSSSNNKDTDNDNNGGRDSPTKRASTPTPLGMVANTALGGVGLVKNTAKGGAGLAVKGVKGGAGLAAKGVKGGAGLAAKGVGAGAGLAAKGVGAGAGLAAKGVGAGAGLAAKGVGAVANTAAGGAGLAVQTIQSGVGIEKTKSRNTATFANEMSIYGSELYSVDFVKKEIKKAKETQDIDIMVVEDLIIRGSEDLNMLMFNMLSKSAMIPTDQAVATDDNKPKKKKNQLDITVSIHGGSDLAACDTDVLGRETSSDPYVIASILSEDKETKLGQTKHLAATLNPTWNVNLSKILPPKTFSHKKPFILELKIMDYDVVGDDDCMGVVHIPLEFEKDSTKLSKAPRWYIVPEDSAEKAGGKLKVGVEAKLCYGEVLPEGNYQRHWRKLTFYDNISSAEDYHYYTNQKKEFQNTVRKILKKKDIKIFPIRFEAKVEISMMDIYETIALLDLIGNDETIVQFSIHESDYDRTMMSEPMRAANSDGGMEIKKLPKVLSKLFDPETLEWKEDSEPIVIRIKYGTKPPAQGKRRRSSLFQNCSQRLENYAKKSSGWEEEDESMSFSQTGHGDASFVAHGHGSILKV